MRKCTENVNPGRGNTLTALPAPTYHNWMTPKSHVVARAICWLESRE